MKNAQNLFIKAKAVITNAYTPYSHFPVAACILDDQGNTHCGCNYENASYSLTLCAEASAIAAMITHGGKSIQEIAIVIPGEDLCPPCGSCRQRIFEFAQPETKIHLFTLNGQQQSFTMANLLPYPFGANNLELK